ncbi:hypothetical protein DYBT9275_04789 [Dyadobacter sp. CECT 9275]|uniref:Uncharacterized protein n=2 Tax=Dyadobacter helix TaxID=2822344 RepID=A0A916JIM0_9BACT|nr:hypothetical protein DYBT9275_04789 [Dyadobacter sp. CECT 9275]
MENFNKSVWNRLYNDGEHVATELEAILPGCRRWVAIYKAKPEHPLLPWKRPEYKYSILYFELKQELIDEYFSEEDKQRQRTFYVDNEDELFAILHEQGVDLSSFTYPWKCDYPL